MGWIAMRRGQLHLAGQHFDRAVGLNPNDVSIAVDRANCLMYMNKLDEALRYLDLMLERDPYPPTYIWEVRGQILYFLRRYDEAIAALRNMRAEHFWKPMFLAAAYAQSGQSADARRAIASLLKAKPKESLNAVSQRWINADMGMRDNLLEGLRQAGLPE
jgi:predicted Zn-dependent protease